MSKEIEEWRDIKGYEGLYQVSNKGRVKRLERSYTERNSRKAIHILEEKELKPSKTKKGYLLVVLYKNNERKIKKIHRLVAEAFLENTDNLPQVNHKDECKTNNKVENLEWCDNKYNCMYGTRGKRIGAKISGDKNSTKRTEVRTKISKALSKKVLQYTLEGELVKVWNSTCECGRNGYHQGAVAACCRCEFNRNGNNIYKGYKWSYEPL